MNTQNAHLYLPFVQALVDGKTLQHKVSDGWIDMLYTDFSSDPESYRIKPTPFPPIPEQYTWHNPDCLTAEQVGDGCRLLVVGENDGRHKDIAQRWSVLIGWDEAMDGSGVISTYRIPIQTPFPNGQFIQDGKLVTPWVPKFKVGDEVQIANPHHNWDHGLRKIEKVIMDRKRYVLSGDSHETSWPESALKPYSLSNSPWSLSRHIPGFRPLRDGEEWHRTDWTEEMLEGGWRPLLKGEALLREDEIFQNSRNAVWGNPISIPWFAGTDGGETRGGDPKSIFFIRTRRPLPEPPKRVPLGPEDVPQGSAFVPPNDKGCRLVPLQINALGIVTYNGHDHSGDAGQYRIDGGGAAGVWHRSWRSLMRDGWGMLLPGEVESKPCSKPAP